MSAIAGILSRKGLAAPDRACTEMLAALAAYGPDDQRQWSSDAIAMGRCLFATLPEDRFDHQPLVGAGGRYVLVADIRLDNRDEIIERLGRSVPETASVSDADLLLYGIERWGEGVLDRLVGDFAYALWDQNEQALTLVRDPVGERPLHYCAQLGLFAFASMPKGLHALPSVPREPDPDGLMRFLGLVPEMGRISFFKGIDQVPPGHLVRAKNGNVSVRRYWHAKPRDLGFSKFDDYREAFREHLDRAVQARLRGCDGRIATHLSGGWDSSSVATTAARLLRQSGGRVDAFTAVPRFGKEYRALQNRITDEGPIASKTAAMHPNIDHTLLETPATSPLSHLDHYVSIFERPVYDPSNHAWLGQVRKAAADRGHRVLLTGEMGNFTISSAPNTILAYLLHQRRWRQWWKEARAMVASGGARYRGVAATSMGPWLPGFVWELARPFASRAGTKSYTGINPAYAPEVERLRGQSGNGLTSRFKNYVQRTEAAMHYYDTGPYRKGAIAGWGMDERDPTTDRRLIDFCLSLPMEMLLKDGVRRPLARAALNDRLPPEVIEEKRKGFQAADWYEGVSGSRSDIAELLERMAANPLAESLIDVDGMTRLVSQWPASGWENPLILARYRGALMGAVSAGHFILSTSPHQSR